MVDVLDSDKPRWGDVVALLLIAVVVRVAGVAALSHSLHDDPDAYRALAENLRQHGIFGSGTTPTAFRPPLYPVVLAALAFDGHIRPMTVAILHVVLGVGTVAVSYRLARAWDLGRWSAVAALLVAVDPILINQSALVMTETLATFLATVALLALTQMARQPQPSHAVWAGIALGLASLCRPTFIPWLGLSGLIVVIQGWQQRSPRMLGSSAILLVSAGIVIAPWAVRNQVSLGVAKLTTTHGGYTVLLGNNPSFYRYLREAPRGTTWDSAELAQAWELRQFATSVNDPLWDLDRETASMRFDREPIHRTEFEDDELAYALAKRYIASEPSLFIYSCLVRVSRLWQVTPYRIKEHESAARQFLRRAIGGWYTVIFVLAIGGLVARRRELLRSPLIWALLLAFSFTAVHALYWSNMRMRAPCMPPVCLLATWGLAQISCRWQRRKP